MSGAVGLVVGVLVGVLGLLLVALSVRLMLTGTRPIGAGDDHSTARRRYTRAAVVGLLIAAVPYVWVLWNGRLDPLRTAIPEGYFSGFYDLQARALFHGTLAVPKGSLGIEAFVVNGRHYMYFPPFPAILRMPILAVTSSLDGKLTAPSLLLAWMVTGLFVALLVWRVRVLVRGSVTLGNAEAAGLAVLIATLMSGTVLLYLGSLPWVYHEAYAWSTAGAVGALFVLIGVLERPTLKGVVGTGALTAVSVLSRTTTGWGCVIAIALAAIWFSNGRGGNKNRRFAVPLFLAAAIPFAVGCAVTWVKFGSLFTYPLQNQVWTQVNAHRREVLNAHSGGLLTIDFLPTTMLAYLRPDGIRFNSIFPFVTLPATAPKGVAGAILDQTYRTASVPASMPLLFLLGVWGLVIAFRPGAVGLARLTRIPLIGAAASTGVVFLYGYIGERYLSDFVPIVALASVVGFVDVWRRLAARPRGARRAALAIVIVLGAFGILANLAIATTTERLASGTTEVRGYVRRQNGVSDMTGDPIGGYVARGSRLPHLAPADQLFVVGDCDAVYVSTANIWDPWVPVEFRPVEATVTVNGSPPAGEKLPVLTIGDDPTLAPASSVAVEGASDGRFRFRVDVPSVRQNDRWRRVEPGRAYRLTVLPANRFHLFFVYLDGQKIGVVPQSSLNTLDFDVDHRPKVIATPRSEAPSSPVTVTKDKTSTPSLCRNLVAARHS